MPKKHQLVFVMDKTIIDDEGKQKQIEVDIIGKDGKDILIIGECKRSFITVD